MQKPSQPHREDPRTTNEGREEATNMLWGQDIMKAKLTQELRGEGKEMEKNKLFVLISNIISAILGAVGGFLGSN